MAKKKTVCSNRAQQIRKYTDYIKNHQDNVKKAFFQYYDSFIKVFGITATMDAHSCIRAHDTSKFCHEEFLAYADYFFPLDDTNEDKYYPYYSNDPIYGDVHYDFDEAWHHHYTNNPHHPKYHMYTKPDGSTACRDMPDEYIIEMLCDWIAMGMYNGNGAYDYWCDNKEKMLQQMSIYTFNKTNLFFEYCKKNNIDI